MLLCLKTHINSSFVAFKICLCNVFYCCIFIIFNKSPTKYILRDQIRDFKCEAKLRLNLKMSIFQLYFCVFIYLFILHAINDWKTLAFVLKTRIKIPSPNGSPASSIQVQYSFRLGWSFWLMTPCFFLLAFAAMVGAAILGCTCVTNKIECERRRQQKQDQMTTISQGGAGRAAQYVPNYGYYSDATDPQVLRL